jgi:hypothetical protein
MKYAILKFFSTLAAIILLSCGCDYVDVPQQAGGGGNDADIVIRKVLMEETTGHTCIACPLGATTIEQLHNYYGEQMITIAVHHGWFADACPPVGTHSTPNGAPAGSFSEDFTTDGEGAEYELNFANVFAVLPNGMVNRLGVPGGTYAKSSAEWGPTIDSLVQIPPSADLDIEHTYNTSTRALTLTVEGDFIDAQNGTFNVAVMITEDSLVGWQIDGSTFVPDFVFMHVLRGCVNTPGSIIGTPVMTGNIDANTPFTWTMQSAYTVNSNFNARHCHLVAILYNTATFEVLQAEEVELVE